MKRLYRDPNLFQNSALACFLLTMSVKEYEKSPNAETPFDLMNAFLVLPFVWHKASCDAIENRQLKTSLRSVLAEHPEILAGFKDRMSAFAPIALQGINLASASGLLEKKSLNNGLALVTTFDRWPRLSRSDEVPPEMERAVVRLANWFAQNSTPQLYRQLLKG